MIESRAARVRQHGGALGVTCGTLEGVRDRVHRAEHGSFVLFRRTFGLLLRVVLEFLILAVVAVFELDTLRRRAARALVSRPR